MCNEVWLAYTPVDFSTSTLHKWHWSLRVAWGMVCVGSVCVCLYERDGVSVCERDQQTVIEWCIPWLMPMFWCCWCVGVWFSSECDEFTDIYKCIWYSSSSIIPTGVLFLMCNKYSSCLLLCPWLLCLLVMKHVPLYVIPLYLEALNLSYFCTLELNSGYTV